MNHDPSNCTQLKVVEQRLATIERDQERFHERLTGSKATTNEKIEGLRAGVSELQVTVASTVGKLDTDIAGIRKLLWWFMGITATTTVSTLIGLVFLLAKLLAN